MISRKTKIFFAARQKEEVSIEAAGSDLSMMELSDSIPATYIPNYEVDRNGFYTVSGRFPEDVSNEERDWFI